MFIKEVVVVRCRLVRDSGSAVCCAVLCRTVEAEESLAPRLR